MRNKRILYLCIAISFLFIHSEAPSQDNENIKLTVTNADIQQILPSQLDFQNFQNTIWLFTITIEVINPEIREVKFIDCKIIANLKDGGKIELLEGDGFYSEPFPVERVKTITNLDFGNSIIIRNFKISSEVRNNIIEPVLASGRFPPGEYIFKINVADAVNPKVRTSKDISLVLESFTQVELRSPRDGELTNEFPLFEWNFDGREVELTINEKSPGVSREEAISKLPLVYHNTFIGRQNSFQYPSTNIRPLQKGKSYVWKIVGKFLETGGYGQIQSPIAEFKVADETSPALRLELLDQLELILG
ncbi:MAG: hypothetical protein KKG06_11450, partial [Bacteroidetes bacterium]|nr:hypothetical protein [Bacteroidota bacterium]MBU1423768.1 hypothetical protein [Bacteroidota bacterium]